MVVSVGYVIVIACLVIYEHKAINPCDQFYHRHPSVYVFWRWSTSTYLSGRTEYPSHYLQLRVGFIAELMFLPPLVFALLVYAARWRRKTASSL